MEKVEGAEKVEKVKGGKGRKGHNRIVPYISFTLPPFTPSTLYPFYPSNMNTDKEVLIQEIERLRAEVAHLQEANGQQSVQKKLYKSNRLLSELHENAFDLIQVTNEAGELLFVNRAWKDKLQYTDKDLKGLRFSDIVHPQYKSITRSYLDKADHQSSAGRFRSVFLAKNGEKVYVSGSVSVRIDEQGKKFFRGIFYDITDQVRAERARNLYNSIVNHTIHSASLQELYQSIYGELQKAVEAESFYLALREDSHLTFPFYRGKYAQLLEDEAHRQGLESLIDYAITLNKPLFLHREDILELVAIEAITPLSVVPSIWIGVPLVANNQAVGLLAVQDADSDEKLNARDLKLLSFISGQLALAIERKANEEALNEQRSRLNAIFESSSHIIWSVDRQLRFTSFNYNFEDTLKTYYHVTPKKGKIYRAEGSLNVQKFIEFWREKYERAFQGMTAQFEIKFKDQQGKYVWKQVFVNPIYREDGSIREVSGIAHDITQSKEAERALLESEEKFRTIYESFQDIYFRCRMDGIITMISPSIQELTHYETYDVIGKNITNYYLYDKRTKNLIRQLAKQKRVRNFEATLIANDGTLLQCICNIRVVDNFFGKASEIEGVARDITQLKKATAALQKAKNTAERSLRVKEAFLANMSHEIRTPMNGILNMIDLLADTPLREDQAEYVTTIKDSSETLLTLLNDILDLSKIEAGKMKLYRKPASVTTLVHKTYQLFAQQASAKSIAFTYQVTNTVPAYLLLDEVRWLQVLNNLVANAIKFTHEQGTVTIRVEPADGEQGKPVKRTRLFKVSIVDSGIGISLKDQKALFQNFTQLDASASKRYQGTGLGLSIARQLVQLMEGDIGVTSQPGQGSTFWFTFRASPTEQAPPQERKTQYHYFTENQPRVLVVDDNAINRKVASKILKKAHCIVTLAESGPQAIDLISQHPFDIVFMDIQMPGMDGIEATRRIKALALDKTPPIVAMTAYAMSGDEARFLKAGLDGYVSKPIRPEVLLPKTATITGFPLLQTETAAAEQAVPEEKKIINFAVLETLEKYGGKEMVTDTLQEFEEEALHLLSEITKAAKKCHYPKILSNLHTLKGNASTLGVEKVAHLATTLEADMKQQYYHTLTTNLPLLQKAVLEFQSAFRQTFKPTQNA